jgi:hypothetical protein
MSLLTTLQVLFLAEISKSTITGNTSKRILPHSIEEAAKINPLMVHSGMSTDEFKKRSDLVKSAFKNVG